MTLLIEQLPPHYQSSKETRSLQNALNWPLLQAAADRDDLFLQLDPSKATWGLRLWEKAYGIMTDGSKTLEQRRSRLLSKIRGQGTSTMELILSVVESFGIPAVDIIEHTSEYKFELVILGPVQPEVLKDVEGAINEIKPAHLDFWFTVEAKPFTAHIRLGGLMWAIRETTLPPL